MTLELDESIKKDVVDQLYWDERINAANVQVEVIDGQVSMVGSVNSHKARRSAESNAWMIDGVRSVDNQLVVRSSPQMQEPQASELEDRAAKALQWSTDIDGSEIKISTHDGVVTLTGSVDAYWKMWEAEKVVSGLAGVTEVENQLSIVPTERVLDKVIAKYITDALERNAYIEANEVVVRVEDNVVTLTGEVPNNFVRSQAENAAAYTGGVVDVKNELVINPVV